MKRNTKVAIVTIALVGAFALYELVPWPTESRTQENIIHITPGINSISRQVSPPSNGIVVSQFHALVEFQSNVSVNAYIINRTNIGIEISGFSGRLECYSSKTEYVYGLSGNDVPVHTVFIYASEPFYVTLTVTIDFLDFPNETDWLFSILAGIGAFIWVAILLTAKEPPEMKS